MITSAIILAAGYATRLYPLTENFPKPLLEIEKNKPVINYIVEKLEKTEIKKVYVITNNKFFAHFQSWKNNLKTNLKIEIINDNTNSMEDKLGAIGDLNFAINKLKLQEPLMILGGDNLFDFELFPITEYFKKHDRDMTVLSEQKDLEKLKQASCIKINKNNKIIFFEEKPQNPVSSLLGVCIYIYKQDTIDLIKKYIEEGNNPDQPGRFLQWLYKKKEVRGYPTKEIWFDIGTLEQLEKAREAKKIQKGKIYKYLQSTKF